MNRLQKKCLVAAAGFHLLLLLILFVGPAFLPSNKADNLPQVDFIPSATLDALISGGGNPAARPTPPTPPTPPVQQITVPPPQSKPEPVKEVVKAPTVKEIEKPEPPKVNKPDPEAIETPKPPKRKIEVSTTVVKHNANDFKAAAAKAAADAAHAKELADARRTTEISKALSSLKGGLSSSTKVDMDFGPGGGGPTYANFNAALKSIYERAWNAPDGATDKDISVTVTVTIARDGTVISARITRSSGNQIIDRSVQEMLDRVKTAVPLPEGTSENQRTVSFKLNALAKLVG